MLLKPARFYRSQTDLLSFCLSAVLSEIQIGSGHSWYQHLFKASALKVSFAKLWDALSFFSFLIITSVEGLPGVLIL